MRGSSRQPCAPSPLKAPPGQALTLELAAELQLLLLQPADPPLVGLGGQAVLQAALDVQVQLVLARLRRQLSEASAVGEGAAGRDRGRRLEEKIKPASFAGVINGDSEY